MKSENTNKELLELMWERFPEIMSKGCSKPLTYAKISKINETYHSDSGLYSYARAIESAGIVTHVTAEGHIEQLHDEIGRLCEQHNLLPKYGSHPDTDREWDELDEKIEKYLDIIKSIKDHFGINT